MGYIKVKNEFYVYLEKSENISDNVKHFTFRIPKDLKWSFTPGQFISVKVESNGRNIRRNYSIASLKDNVIEFACSYVKNGIASEFLFNLKTGERICVEGP